MTTLVMAHGAGSHGAFLGRAFPSSRTGLDLVSVEDRTGRLGPIMSALARAATAPRNLLGGVSLGAHAAASLLVRDDLPDHVVGGVLVMPAWSGHPDRVAAMTDAAAEALGVLGPDGVLAELDADDWVTDELADAWRTRPADDLVAELHAAARQSAPEPAELRRIPVPCVVVALGDDPLHPESVARQWADWIPAAVVRAVPRDAPGDDRAVFADAVADGLRTLGLG